MDDKNLDDRSGLGKRLRRYGATGTTMAGLAGRLLGDRFLGTKIDRDQHAEQLMKALGNLKGPLMKVGQILSTIPEALPPEYAREFQQLQNNAPPMSWTFVRRRMKSELGTDWQDKFASFEREPAAAASLGQVHKATSHDGKTLACKLQYPDMQSAIDSDLNQLKLILSAYRIYDKSIETGQIFDELRDRLNEELDYTLEAKHTQIYSEILKEESGVHVPNVQDDLSTSRLLTTNWLNGTKVMDFVDSDLETRNQIALNMFRAWYVPFYHYGLIHGDPHLGNYTVRKDLSINLLDFGCVRIFPPKFVFGVIDLYKALQSDDLDRAVGAFEAWGFEALNKDQIETLMIWARFLYGPLLEDKTRTIGETNNGVYGREIAEEVHTKLRTLSKEKGGIAIPREFVFMDRAALGLGSVFIHLKSEINWYKIFNELIDDFDSDDVQSRQTNLLTMFNYPEIK